MDRKASALDETPLRTASGLTPLSDDDLSMVSGACHGRRRRRHGHQGHDEEGGLSSLLSQLLQQLNVASIIQLVTVTGNITGDVSLVAGVSQSNSGAQSAA
jgi:hypothetical protein